MSKYLPIIIILSAVVIHRFATIPYLNYLASDPANIATFAIGIDYNDFFDKDPVLSNTDTFSWYIPLYVYLIRFLTHLFNENVYLAFWSQVDISMFIFALGCYLFGRDFIGSKKYGIFFLLLNLAFIPASWGGGWGIPIHQTRPFVLFISFLPIILWFGWTVRERKYGYPLYFAILSSTVFIHPPSAIFWIFAQWWAGWLIYDEKYGFKYLIINQLIAAGIILLILLPYILIFSNRYLTSIDYSLNYDLIMEISKYRVNDLAFRPFYYPYAVWKEYPFALKMISLSFPVTALYLVRKGEYASQIKICLVWIASFIFLGTCIPFIQLLISSYIKVPPYSFDFPRCYMFFPFIIYAITLLFFKNIEDNYKNKFISEKVFAIGIIISVVCWVAILYFPQSVLPVLRGFARSEFIPRPLTQSTAFISTLAKAVSGPNESISSFPGGSSALCIRYDAKRPLLYCFKDGGTLLYGDLAKARGWYRNSKEVRNLRRVLSSDYSPSEKGASLVRWSESLNAQFLIVSGYKNTVLDFGSARTIQCHGDTIVDLRNRDFHSSNRQPDDLHSWGFEPKGKVIDLFAPNSFPVWLKRLPNSKDVSNIKKGFTDKHIIIEAAGKKKELGYKIQISPGKIYLFTCWLYYERNSADFDISIGSWEAKLFGGRLFKDKNPVLSESGKWKKHEILILVPPEIHPNSVNIDFYVLSIKGEGKVIVKSPTFQYMEKFPLKDGLEINADFGAFKESNKLHYRRNS